jgi:hypothetical protein
MPASSYDAESLVSAGLAPRRPVGWVVPVEERGHRLREVPKGLLLHGLGAGGQPAMRGPGFGELSALLELARRTLATRSPVSMLLDGEVPYVPSVGAVAPQHRFLSRCGQQPVSGHANTLSTITDISEEVRRRFLPGVKARVFAPRSR